MHFTANCYPTFLSVIVKTPGASSPSPWDVSADDQSTLSCGGPRHATACADSGRETSKGACISCNLEVIAESRKDRLAGSVTGGCTRRTVRAGLQHRSDPLALHFERRWPTQVVLSEVSWPIRCQRANLPLCCSEYRLTTALPWSATCCPCSRRVTQPGARLYRANSQEF